jgi:hypothetical protein
MMRMPAISRALWPTVTLTPYLSSSAAIFSPSDSVFAIGFSVYTCLPALGDLFRERQVLLIRNSENHTLNCGIGEQRLHIGRCTDTGLLCKRTAFFLRTAIAGDDL